MKKWYETQFAVIATIIIVIPLIMIIGETITKRYFLYSEEMLVINSAIMILSGVLMFVGRYFSEN